MYYTLAEGARIARCSLKRLQNLMANGTLVEGVHFARPRGRRPLIIAAAFHAWLEGRDSEFMINGARRTNTRGSRVNLNGV